MAKLYFRYGTMDSAKTLNLLAVAHNYRKQGKEVILAKPALDDRFGEGVIGSRSGLTKPADLLIDPDQQLDPARFEGIDCVLVDEAQFLSPAVIEQLRALTLTHGVPVICYGLRTDFQTRLFPGAARLMELADTIEEVKVTCQFCDRKAVFNLRFSFGDPGDATVEGEQVVLGADDQYAPVCWGHYVSRVSIDGLAQLGMAGARLLGGARLHWSPGRAITVDVDAERVPEYQVPAGAFPIAEHGRAAYHVTLVSSRMLVDHERAIGEVWDEVRFGEAAIIPAPDLDPRVNEADHPDPEDDRRSWWMRARNQEAYRQATERLLVALEGALRRSTGDASITLPREPERVFHVTVANADGGDPAASVGRVWLTPT